MIVVFKLVESDPLVFAILRRLSYTWETVNGFFVFFYPKNAEIDFMSPLQSNTTYPISPVFFSSAQMIFKSFPQALAID